MCCHRCAGLLVEEWLYDKLGETHFLPAWRCVNCGAVEDQVIQTNQRKESHDRSV